MVLWLVVYCCCYEPNFIRFPIQKTVCKRMGHNHFVVALGYMAGAHAPGRGFYDGGNRDITICELFEMAKSPHMDSCFFDCSGS